MDDAVKELLRRNRAAAAEELTALRGGADMALPELEAHLRRFILYKFQLDPAETDSDSIAEITELSLAKTAGIARELAEQVDNAKSCDGATSAIVKKGAAADRDPERARHHAGQKSAPSAARRSPVSPHWCMRRSAPQRIDNSLPLFYHTHSP